MQGFVGKFKDGLIIKRKRLMIALSLAVLVIVIALLLSIKSHHNTGITTSYRFGDPLSAAIVSYNLNNGSKLDTQKAIDQYLATDISKYTKTEKTNYYYQLAFLQQSIGSYSGSITNYSKAIDLNQSDASAYLGRARSYAATNDKAKAKADYNKAQQFYIDQSKKDKSLLPLLNQVQKEMAQL